MAGDVAQKSAGGQTHRVSPPIYVTQCLVVPVRTIRVGPLGMVIRSPLAVGARSDGPVCGPCVGSPAVMGGLASLGGPAGMASESPTVMGRWAVIRPMSCNFWIHRSCPAFRGNVASRARLPGPKALYCFSPHSYLAFFLSSRCWEVATWATSLTHRRYHDISPRKRRAFLRFLRGG